MFEANKSYTVKDWFTVKLMKERNLHRISHCIVFAVLKETEKAAYAMLDLGCHLKMTTWVPKSCIEIDDNNMNDDRNVRLGLTYEEAAVEHEVMWNSFC